MKGREILVLLAVLIVHCNGLQMINITKDWMVDSDQLKRFQDYLPKLESDTWTWHWGTEQNSLRWDKQGFIDQTELDWYNNNTAGMVEGGGFYVSLDQTDSKSFGIFPVGVLFPKGSLRLESRNYTFMREAMAILGKGYPSLVELTALGRIVPFYDIYSRTWIVVHNATLLQKVVLGWKIPEFKQEFGTPEYEYNSYHGDLYAIMGQLSNFSEETKPYVNMMIRHWSLIEFLGPLQANRMRVEYGFGIWKRIEMNKFEGFHTLISTPLQILPTFIGRIAGNSRWNGFANWTSNQMEDVFPFIYARLTGKNANEMWRDEETFNEGDFSIKSYTIIDAQYQSIQSSPYLNVEVIEKNAKNGTLTVRISHPSVFNIAKFREKLSAALVKNISSYSIQKLKIDNTLRKDLNRRVVMELVSALLVNLTQSRPDFASIGTSDFFRHMGMIQPFNSDNYLMRKVYEKLAIKAAMSRMIFNSPLEIVPEASSFLPSYYRHQSQSFSNLWLNMRREGIRQASLKVFNPSFQMDYFSGWNNFSINLFTFTQDKIGFDEEGRNLMKNKMMVGLFDRYLPSWRQVISEDLDICLTPIFCTNNGRIQNFINSIQQTQDDIWIYTWKPYSKVVEWDKQGFIDKASLQTEVFTFSSQMVPLMTMDQISFPLAVLLRKGTPIFYSNSSLDTNYFFKTEVSFSDLNLLISVAPFAIVQGYQIIIDHPQLTSKACLAYRIPEFDLNLSYNEYANGNNFGLWSIIIELSKGPLKNQSHELLRYWTLMDFLGPIQALDKKTDYGEQIWEKIDKPKFERYFQTQYSLLNSISNGSKEFDYIGSNGNYYIGYDMDSDKWADFMIDNVTKIIWKGLYPEEGDMFREDAMWNDGFGYERNVTNIPAWQRSFNPYLEFEILNTTSNPEDIIVKYQHPNVFNVAQYAGLISPQLYFNISSLLEEMKSDDGLRREYNKRLMRELLHGIFVKIVRQSVSRLEESEFQQSFQRIQPFKRDNYLIRRLLERIVWFKAARMFDSSPTFAPELISYSSSSFMDSGIYSIHSWTQVLSGGIAQIAKSIFQKPDYLSDWDHLREFSRFCTLKMDDQDRKLIKERNTVELFDANCFRWRDRS